MAAAGVNKRGGSTKPMRSPPDEILKAGLSTFRTLGRKKQLLLAQAVVSTRNAELRTAYPDLVSIGFGFKSKRDPSTRTARLIRTPCVVFEVKRKLKLAGRAYTHRMLPAFLYAYVGEGAARSLCAVPTDVKTSSDFGKAVPHLDDADTELPFGIVVKGAHADDDGSAGTIACGVTRPSDPDQLYALSCRHVLSRSLLDEPDVPSDCNVVLGSMSGPVVGKTATIRGSFSGAPAPSFDAQLIRVTSPSQLKASLQGVTYDLRDPMLTGPENIPNGFYVATPRADVNNARLKVWVTFVDCPMYRPMPYPLPGGEMEIAHVLVIRGEAREERLEPGDSGSPATLLKRGGTLIGMYLGGDGFNAYFIPAWQLPLPRNYGLHGEASWSISNG